MSVLSPSVLLIALVKTIKNGWATSCKRQERDRGCLFGCGHPHARDKLTHYINWPAAWKRLPAYSNYPDINALAWQEKLGLSSTSGTDSYVSLHVLLEAYQSQYADYTSNVISRFRDAARRTNMLLQLSMTGFA